MIDETNKQKIRELIPIVAKKLKECGSYNKLPYASSGIDYKTYYSMIKEAGLINELKEEMNG